MEFPGEEEKRGAVRAKLRLAGVTPTSEVLHSHQ